MQQDYYSTLGLSPDATPAQIKKAYRKLALNFHPDRNHGDLNAEERFKDINEAYSVLGDKEKRWQYDRFGIEGIKRDFGDENYSNRWKRYNRKSEGPSITLFEQSHDKTDITELFNNLKYYVKKKNFPMLYEIVDRLMELSNDKKRVNNYFKYELHPPNIPQRCIDIIFGYRKQYVGGYLCGQEIAEELLEDRLVTSEISTFDKISERVGLPWREITVQNAIDLCLNKILDDYLAELSLYKTGIDKLNDHRNEIHRDIFGEFHATGFVNKDSPKYNHLDGSVRWGEQFIGKKEKFAKRVKEFSEQFMLQYRAIRYLISKRLNMNLYRSEVKVVDNLIDVFKRGADSSKDGYYDSYVEYDLLLTTAASILLLSRAVKFPFLRYALDSRELGNGYHNSTEKLTANFLLRRFIWTERWVLLKDKLKNI